MTESKECIAQWISEIHDAHPEWKEKQIITAAYTKCGASKGDFEEGFCPYNILSRITFTKSFSDHLYNDFTGLPTSVMVANAVDFALPRLKQELPDMDEIELLKTAYGLAQEVLKNSDFETYSEKPIYFAISIPNSELEAFELELRRAAYYSDEGEIDFTDDDLSKIYTDDKTEPFFKPETNVSSSNVAEVGYDAGKLRIFFKNGGGYEYPVPQTFYLEMMASSSKGSFVWNYLRGKTPGRVIDNPSKMTPGGVGGSIVPYFKVKGAQMSQQQQARSVQTFLKAARSGNAKVGSTPIKQINRPTFKAFDRFVSTYQKGTLFKSLKMRQIGRFVKKLPQPGQKQSTQQTTSSKIPKAAAQKSKPSPAKSTKKSKKKDESDKSSAKSEADTRALIRAQIKRLRKQLKQARENELDVNVEGLEKKIETLQKRLDAVGDFTDDTIAIRLGSSEENSREMVIESLQKDSELRKIAGIKEEDVEFLTQKELIEAGNKILKKQPEKYLSLKEEYYKITDSDEKQPVLEVNGIFVNPQIESFHLLNEATNIMILEGEITGLNNWGDGEIMKNHKLIKNIDPNDKKDILRNWHKYGNDLLEFYFDKFEIEEELEEEIGEEEADKFYESLEQENKKADKEAKESKGDGKGRGWHGDSERHSKARETGSADFSHLTDDFTSDMHYFRGPITRAGKFQYGKEVKTKDLDNLREMASKYKHLPSFDSHQETEILGFAYNFTDDPDLFMKDHPKYSELVGKPYIFSEGYAFKDIENSSDIDIKADETLLPTSMRFLDSNEGTDSNEQHLSALVHLAISTDQSDRDRCSTLGGDPCWVSFHDKQATPKLIGDFMPGKKKEEEDDKSGSKADEDEDKDAEEEEKKDEKSDFVPKKAYDAVLKDVADLMKKVDDFAIIEEKRDKRDQAREKEMDKIKLEQIKSDFTKEDQLYTIKSDFLKEADLMGLSVLKQALVPHTPAVDGHSQLFDEDFSSNKYQKDLAEVKKRYSKSYGVGE